jgi:hypothetical protein
VLARPIMSEVASTTASSYAYGYPGYYGYGYPAYAYGYGYPAYGYSYPGIYASYGYAPGYYGGGWYGGYHPAYRRVCMAGLSSSATCCDLPSSLALKLAGGSRDAWGHLSWS